MKGPARRELLESSLALFMYSVLRTDSGLVIRNYSSDLAVIEHFNYMLFINLGHDDCVYHDVSRDTAN